jgi:DNA-binding beta-propeller fold protein YncE
VVSGARRPGRLAGAVLGAALSLGACVETDSTREEEVEHEPRVVQWPPAPEPARFVYLRSLRASTDVEPPSRESLLRALVGGGASRAVAFDKPYAVAAHAGRIYVTDTVLRLVHAFDVPRRRYFQFGLRREGTLSKPLGIAVDGNAMVYVADATARRVVVYDRLGLYQRSLGGPDELARPTAVAVTPDGSRVYVVDTGDIDGAGHRIVIYDERGRRIGAFGERGHEPGQLNLPVAAGVGPGGELFVLDAGNFRVQVFDAEGRLLRTWGSVGRGFGQFARPKSLAVDQLGQVYVSDSSFGNVQVFSPDGRLLLPVGEVSRQDAPGRFALLSGVAVDEVGHVYLVDPLFRKVEILRRMP